MSFNLFGPATKNSIRVGYISTDRGFVDGITVCEANDYAKVNPGVRFIFRTRDNVRYIGINDVNKLTPNDLASSEGECGGLQFETDCGPPQVYFYGGGGVGVKANPVVGQDGSILAVDLVSGGFGYQYPPIVEIKDNCEIGAGVVARSVLGEITETVEYYDQESDFEEYEICNPTDVGYGRRYGPNGEDLGPWEPTVYTKLDEDPIRREIQKYQDFLRRGTNPWWTTRLYPPLRMTSANKVTRTKFDVTDATFLEKQLRDGVSNPVGWNDFMNAYAISPVPPSNVKGSDYAGTTFTFEWEENFPYDGEYVFRGLCDNSAQLYLDNELLDNLRGFRDKPNTIKKTLKEGVHRIRLDLFNAPVKERVVRETVIKQVAGCDFIKRGNDFYMLVGGNVNTKISLQLSYDDDPNAAGTAITKIIIPNPGGTDLVLERRKTSGGAYERTGTVRQSAVFALNDNVGYGPIRFEGTTKKPQLAKPNLFYGPTTDRYGQIDFFDLHGTDVNARLNILNAENLQESRPAPASTQTGTPSNVFNTIDYINKADRKLWRTFPSVGRDGDFIHKFGVTPFDPNTDEANTNSFDGTHTIFWRNVNFSEDANYIIELMVDDAVTLTFSGPGEQVVITKKGYSSPTTSTGKSTEVRFFKAGNYTIKADLEQIKGKPLAQGNPMALAINIDRSSVIEQVAVPKSWNENPMGVALAIDAPQPPIPQEPVVQQQEGRCPNNPIWTTRFPGGKEKWYPVRFDPTRWSRFMNRYAISPIAPLSLNGTDGGGIIYRNSWSVDIPYDGFYAVRGTVDNFGKVIIDGKVVLGSRYKSPYTFRQGPNDPDSKTLGIPAVTRAFADGLTSADIRVEAAKQGFKINPNAQPLLAQGSQNQSTSSSSSGTEIRLDGFNVENPKSNKVFLTRGMHSIQVEVENQKTETVTFVDHKIFSTNDWQFTPPPPQITEVQPAGGNFFKKGNNYYLRVGGNDQVGLKLELAYSDNPFTAGTAITKVTIPSDDGSVVLIREKSGSTFKERGSVSKKGRFRANQEYGPIVFEGRAPGSLDPEIANTGDPKKDPGTFHQRIKFFDGDGNDTNATLTLIPPPDQISDPRVVTVQQPITKDGVTYSGPELASYRQGFISPKFKNVEDFRANFMGKTWNLVWSNVDFPEDGQYDLAAEADDEVIVKVGGVEVGRAKVFEGQRRFSFSTTKGKKTVELILTNIPGNNRSTFDTNPVVAAVIITRKTATTTISKPWTINPVGISAILIPPPCPKRVKGKGVVLDVEVADPGNGYPIPQGDSYPVALRLKSVIVENSGINYNCGVDQIRITPNNGAVLDYECDSFGRISRVKVLNPGFGFTRYPEISMVAPPDSPTGLTGVNASFRPQFEVVRDPIVADQQKLIQVTDLVGLKQTGYVDGRAYYGAVFYKEGTRYAGFYETPGDLVQVYDTLQESIDAQVSTPPSAILRQGTDTNSNNPRLNIPGTPENLI